MRKTLLSLCLALTKLLSLLAGCGEETTSAASSIPEPSQAEAAAPVEAPEPSAAPEPAPAEVPSAEEPDVPEAQMPEDYTLPLNETCLLYTSDAADD